MPKTDRPALYQFWQPRYWGVWLMLAILYGLARLPFRWQMGVGGLLGAFMYHSMRVRRHFAEVNIQLCFPHYTPLQQQQLLRRHFDAFGKASIETAMAWWSSDRHLRPLVTIEGLQHLQAATKTGRGVLLLSAHFTTLELTGRLLSLQQPFQVSYKPHRKKPLFNEVMMRARQSRFEQAIPSTEPREMIRSLKAGNILWYAPDQDFGRKQSVFAPFFSIPAMTLTSTARIVRMTNALVVPFYAQRLPGSQGYRLVLEPALTDFPRGDDIADATTLNQLVETWIVAAPEQYLWVHRRFKTRPEGHPKLYRPKPRKAPRK